MFFYFLRLLLLSRSYGSSILIKGGIITGSAKFTAAEKHFLKKQEQYEREILKLRQSYATIVHLNTTLVDENRELKSSNELLKDWNNRLLEYMDITDEDRKQVLQKDKELSQFYYLIKGLGLLI